MEIIMGLEDESNYLSLMSREGSPPNDDNSEWDHISPIYYDSATFLVVFDCFELTCAYVYLVVLLLGQQIMYQWQIWEDIFHYALSLPQHESISLLVVLSAVCSTLWKYINDVYFNDCAPKTTRTIIFLIKSLIDYWSDKMKKPTTEAAQSWMLVIEDAIPLNIIPPNMDLVPYVAPGDMGAEPYMASGAMSASEWMKN